ncbi:hypothetical protein ACJ41O_003003 [Fusarium nematophilum]
MAASFRAHLQPHDGSPEVMAYRNGLSYDQDALILALQHLSAKEYRRLRRMTYSEALRYVPLDTSELPAKQKVALAVFGCDILLLRPGPNSNWVQEERALLKRLEKKLTSKKPARTRPLEMAEIGFLGAIGDGKHNPGNHDAWLMTIVDSVNVVRQKR